MTRPATVVFGLHNPFGAEPIVTVHDVEVGPLIAFRLAHEVDEAVAHVVHFRDEIRVQVDGAAVVMHAIDHVVGVLIFPEANEDVHLVATALQSRSQLGRMHTYSADRNGVQTLPARLRSLKELPSCKCLPEVISGEGSVLSFSGEFVNELYRHLKITLLLSLSK